jgi:hypothetical protein
MSVSRDLYGIPLARPRLGYDLRGKSILIYPKERDDGTWIRGIRRKSKRCIHCGAAEEQLHTSGCDDEVCRFCGNLLASVHCHCYETETAPGPTDTPRVPYRLTYLMALIAPSGFHAALNRWCAHIVRCPVCIAFRDQVGMVCPIAHDLHTQVEAYIAERDAERRRQADA